MAAWTLLWLLLLLDVVSQLPAQFLDSNNQCDWTIWDTTEKQGVRSLHVRCSSGHVDWHHPYGAVRVRLSLPSRGAFLLCFKARAHATTAIISLESSHGATDTALDRLATMDAKHPAMQREVCIESSLGNDVQLYMEADMDPTSSVIGKVQLEYDMEAVTDAADQQQHDHMAECRPCTDDELLKAVCSSDFVIAGSMAQVLHAPQVHESEIQVHVNTVHRQSLPIFPPGGASSLHAADIVMKRRSVTSSVKMSAAAASKETAAAASAAAKETLGSVIAPYKCAVRSGRGSYLFMGRIRLKRAILKCAPRVEHFQKVYRAAVASGKNYCTIEQL